MRDVFLRFFAIISFSLVIFGVGFYVGNNQKMTKSLEKELTANEQFFKLQGDKPENIKATLEIIRQQKLGEANRTNMQLWAIWLPASLMLINIGLTVFYKNKELNVSPKFLREDEK